MKRSLLSSNTYVYFCFFIFRFRRSQSYGVRNITWTFLGVPAHSSFSYLLVYSPFISPLFQIHKHSHTLLASENLQPPERIVAPFSVRPSDNRALRPTCTLSRHHSGIRHRHWPCRHSRRRCLEFYLYLKYEQGHRQTRSNPDGCGISLLHLTSPSSPSCFFFYVHPCMYIQVVPANQTFFSVLHPLALFLPFPADRL